MTTHPPGISLLICTYNGVGRLHETLHCLSQQRLAAAVAWEIILVDNASTDGTADFAQQAWHSLGSPAPLQVLQEPRPGKQYALEVAIRQVRYSYTCIVDDDNRLASDYLQTGYDLLEAHSQIGALGGQNTATFEGREPEWFTAFQQCYAVGPQIDYVSGTFKPLAEGNIGRNVLWGAGMFVRTAVWEELHRTGFRSLLSGRQGENNLTAGEDDELCFAALLLGYEVWYSARLHLQHHMTAGRLTEAYRDRLFYASARSTTRLNAYRNALWGNPHGAPSINLLKDISFIVRGLLKQTFAAPSARPDRAGTSIERMTQRNMLLVLKDAILHFGKVRGYYEQVLQFKHQLNSRTSTLPSQPEH
jgi:glycosyltransferase involved in cell wall biosynthesis